MANSLYENMLALVDVGGIKKIEEGSHRPFNLTHVIFKMVMEIDSCEQIHIIGRPQHTGPIFIGWKQPREI